MKLGPTLMRTPPLTIGEVAGRSGFTVKALRFYDRRGLLPPAGRRPSGYRLYSEADIHRLEFIRQAKALGLTLEAIRELVAAVSVPGNGSTRTRLLRVLDDRIAQTDRPDPRVDTSSEGTASSPLSAA
jgi:MerR family transcriptional regulator, copper efflux regulator